MKTAKKSLVAIVLLCSVMASLLTVPAQAASKNSYWLHGISVPAGGHMKMYYQETAIMIKGRSQKARSEKNVCEAEEKKRSQTLKIAKKCKIIHLEGKNITIDSYGEWAEKHSYQNGDKITFISATLHVKHGKVVQITFST